MTPRAKGDAHETMTLAAAAELGVAHEVRNALAVITSSLYLAKRDRADEAKLLAHLARASKEAERAQQIATAVLELSRGETIAKESVSLVHVIASAEEAAALPEHIAFTATIDPAELSVPGRSILLERALTNLFVNAREALGDARGTIEIVARELDGAIELVIEDDGPGLDGSHAWFEPMVTTKATGSGLGLALVRAVALAHGGDVSASNREAPARGARFRMTLAAV